MVFIGPIPLRPTKDLRVHYVSVGAEQNGSDGSLLVRRCLGVRFVGVRFAGFVVADCASGGCPEFAVTCHVPCYAADNCAFDATLRIRTSR
jgi:hypothetical protein